MKKHFWKDGWVLYYLYKMFRNIFDYLFMDLKIFFWSQGGKISNLPSEFGFNEIREVAQTVQLLKLRWRDGVDWWSIECDCIFYVYKVDNEAFYKRSIIMSKSHIKDIEGITRSWSRPPLHWNSRSPAVGTWLSPRAPSLPLKNIPWDCLESSFLSISKSILCFLSPLALLPHSPFCSFFQLFIGTLFFHLSSGEHFQILFSRNGWHFRCCWTSGPSSGDGFGTGADPLT